MPLHAGGVHGGLSPDARPERAQPPGSTVIPFPICVGENLVGRVNGGNVPPNSQVIGPINNVFGARRRLIFVFNNVGLERVLALGQYRAKRILELLG